MDDSLRSRLIRLGRWPRLAAAALCLLIAVVSAFGGKHDSAPETVRPSPATGEVAVAVSLSDGGAGLQFLHAADRVDIVVTDPAENARFNGLLVLDVRPPQDEFADGAAAGTQLVVAASLSDATRLARLREAEMIATVRRRP